MKKIILVITILLFSTNIIIPELDNYSEESRRIAILEARYKYESKVNLAKNELDGFLLHLGAKESTNNPNSINTLGYIGEYQFGRAALIDVGYGHVNCRKFRRDKSIFPPEDQKDAVIKLMKINERRLRKYIPIYEGKTINGIKITRAGLLAAAHLAGAGNVKKFLRSNGNSDFADAYGTNLTKYLKEFQHHNIDLQYV